MAQAGKHLLVKFQGINDKETAETLHKKLLFISSGEQPQLASDAEFYASELIGMQVFAPPPPPPPSLPKLPLPALWIAGFLTTSTHRQGVPGITEPGHDPRMSCAPHLVVLPHATILRIIVVRMGLRMCLASTTQRSGNHKMMARPSLHSPVIYPFFVLQDAVLLAKKAAAPSALLGGHSCKTQNIFREAGIVGA